MRDSIRSPAVAGLFYPSDAKALQYKIQECFVQAERRFPTPESSPYVALVTPHAGYQYSGRVAATAYRTFVNKKVKKIAILGPSHYVPVSGVAAPTSSVFATPLGSVMVDQKTISMLVGRRLVHSNDVAHAHEHSIEVQLPFLQAILEDFVLVPLVVGQGNPDLVAVLIAALVQQDFFVVISSDLSHFLTYESARQADTLATKKILACDWRLTGDDACGAQALNGLLKYAKDQQQAMVLIAQESSGDLTGDRSRVVGYGAYGLVRGA
jgi:hypothetical protein